MLLALDKMFRDVVKAINGGIEIVNFRGKDITISDTGTANTEFTVAHNLGFTPDTYLVLKISVGGVIYTSTGGTAWGGENIYLKCTAANAAVRLLVLK